MNKEQNFISAVVGINNKHDTTCFLQTVYQVLEEHFLQFELIIVNMNGEEKCTQELRAWSARLEKPITIINMSYLQPLEQCMNAGLDCAIGDYVYEFDSTDMPFSSALIWQAYQSAQEGNDIVAVCPNKENWTSRMFYKVFNKYSHTAYHLRTSAFRLVSRRALNRTHAMNSNMPYRKAAFASSGLKMAVLEFEGRFHSPEFSRFNLATDSLVLYTDFGYKVSLGITVLMLIVTIAELIYTLIIWLTGHPITGWTTTMFVLTFGLTGLFAVMAIMLKYLSLLLKVTFHKQNYLIESVEKL